MEPIDKSGTTREPIELIYPPIPVGFDSINVFAHEFNGYEVYGDELGKLANALGSQWNLDKGLPEDLVLLRSCLFYEARRARFIGGYPGEEDMGYLDALVTKIKDLMAQN